APVHALLVIVRDYKECVIRHLNKKSPARIKPRRLERELSRYAPSLSCYDQFTGPKLLIYYEDFIAHPQETLTLVTQFFNELAPYNTALQEFLDNYEAHKQHGIALYNASPHHFSGTEGEVHKLSYYAHKVPDSILCFMRDYLMTNHPDLCMRYLTRYLRDTL